VCWFNDSHPKTQCACRFDLEHRAEQRKLISPLVPSAHSAGSGSPLAAAEALLSTLIGGARGVLASDCPYRHCGGWASEESESRCPGKRTICSIGGALARCAGSVPLTRRLIAFAGLISSIGRTAKVVDSTLGSVCALSGSGSPLAAAEAPPIDTHRRRERSSCIRLFLPLLGGWPTGEIRVENSCCADDFLDRGKLGWASCLVTLTRDSVNFGDTISSIRKKSKRRCRRP
jgi:hypothetical protein